MGQIVESIFFLVKIFEHEKYAHDFLDGKLFMNRLSYFKKMEGDVESNRSDKYEGVQSWLQPSRIEMSYLGHKFEGLARPVSISFNKEDHLNVFCIWAGHSGGLENYPILDDAVIKKHFEISEDCLKLGNFAVVVNNVEEFLNRVTSAVREKNYGMVGGLVKYYDPQDFHGSFEENKAPFYKQNEYSHQREYRLALETKIEGADAVTLEIGSLRDIAMICNSSEVNQNITVTYSQ